MEGGFRVPMIVRWPGKIPAGRIQNQIMSGLDWFPTLVAAAGNPNIAAELQKGKPLGDRTYKVYLDGYNQIDLLTGQGPSKRKEIFYFAESTLGAVRIDDFKYRFIDQPQGWLGGTVKLDWPSLVNLRLDPFERTGLAGSLAYYNWFVFQFWRFAFVQQEVAKYAQTFLEFPPAQKGASSQPPATERGAREEDADPAQPVASRMAAVIRRRSISAPRLMTGRGETTEPDGGSASTWAQRMLPVWPSE